MVQSTKVGVPKLKGIAATASQSEGLYRDKGYDAVERHVRSCRGVEDQACWRLVGIARVRFGAKASPCHATPTETSEDEGAC